MPTILVVDDHDESVYLLQSLLAGKGYEVLVAENGAVALDLAIRQPPNLVISDVLMPVMDGFRLCRAWKQHARLRSIPFVFYSATYTDPQDEQLALSLGADRFIIKPAEPEVLLEQIRAVLAQHEAGAPSTHALDVSDDEYLDAYNASLIRKLEQKMAELAAANRELRASEGRLRAIGSASPDMICVLDRDGRYIEALTAWPPLLSSVAPEARGEAITDLLPGPEAQRLLEIIRDTIATGAVQEIEQAIALPDGERWFEGRTAPLSPSIMGVPAVVLVARDITGRKQAEQQLQQAQKMEAIGRLTAGIAHDFNNLLTVINGYSSLLLTEPQDAYATIRPDLEAIQQAGERAAILTRQLLAFSRKQVLQPEATDLNQVVGDMETMLRRVLGEDVQLQTDLTPGPWTVMVDPGQIEQVIMNLAINARDAMPGGGRLAIATANVTLDAARAAEEHGVPPGDYVLLLVNDNGHGMSEDVQARIFEPFFTTKGPGIGTGLGLSVVYGIVVQSGGSIAVASAPQAGTSIRIYLPRCALGGRDEPAAAARAGDYAGHETILLVEDDQEVRRFACHVLASHGYHVLEAGDGLSARRQAAQHAGPIQLLLADIVLPDQSGSDLARQLADERPGMRVLMMSGYTDEVLQRHQLPHQEIVFLPKPFNALALVSKVRAVLDAGAQHGLRPG